MAKKSFLDAVDVPVPCSESWDEMTGGEKQRFCASCEKDIHNISAMTSREARKLLYESNEKLCIRIEKDADGKIKTLKKQLHQITRRAPIAASVLSASLTFSALTYAQGKPVVGKMKPTVSDAHKDEQTRATISGTISDPSGALIPGAAIRLINVKDNFARKTISDTEGFYEFKDVAAAIYRIEVEVSAFKKFVSENIEIDGDKNAHLTVTLTLTGETVGVFITDESLPEKNQTAKISDKIETRQIESLLLPRGTVFVLGMFPGVAQTPPKKASAEQQNKTSQISFTIYDATGAVIADAKVELTDQKTKKTFTAVTDQEGVARFISIPRGKYALKTWSVGFRTYNQIIQIKEPIKPNINVTLEAGMVGEVVIINYEISLFQSIAQNDNETVKQAINANFNVNTKDESGQTALHIAVEHENVEVVRFLLEKGAKVNVKDKQKRTPILMIEDSLSDDHRTTVEIVRLLIAKGADFNAQTGEKETLLMMACGNGNIELVKVLLEAGANPNLKDEDGETAMQKTDSDEIKQVLKRYGAR